MKTFIGAVVFTYVLLFAADYWGASEHFTADTCKVWMKHPWYLHLLMPGPGNFCLDHYGFQ